MNAPEPDDTPAAPPTSPRLGDEVDLLLQFVHDRDVLCPCCGYNLRSLTQPTCPECREPLSLKVGVPRTPLAPLLIALAPGGFCLVAVGIFVVMSALHGPPSMRRDPGVWLIVAFMTLSALGAITLARFNRWFVRLDPFPQVVTFLVIWVIHIAVFVIAITAV